MNNFYLVICIHLQLAASLEPVEIRPGSAVSMINASLIIKDNKYILEVRVSNRVLIFTYYFYKASDKALNFICDQNSNIFIYKFQSILGSMI